MSEMYELCLHSIADRACSFYGQDTTGCHYRFWVKVWHRTLGVWNRARLADEARQESEILRLETERYRYVCRGCGAAGYGNATCRDCVAQWPRFGISQESVDRLLKAIGDQPPEAPFGTRWH